MKTTRNITDEEKQVEQSFVIPVIEEHINIEKAIVETGTIKILKGVTHNTETINIPLVHDEHSIEHILMNVFVDDLPSIRREGDTIVIPVLKEVIVKRTLLVEEIRISRQTMQTNEEHNVRLRTETVTIERVPLTGEAK